LFQPRAYAVPRDGDPNKEGAAELLLEAFDLDFTIFGFGVPDKGSNDLRSTIKQPMFSLKSISFPYILFYDLNVELLTE
jgi:hypothetical protein